SHGTGVRRVGSRSSTPSGFGGYFGTGRSSHVAPPSPERFIFTPKWPRSCAACSAPSGVPSTMLVGSPSSAASSICHPLPCRPSTNTPLRVPTTTLRAISTSRKRLEHVDLAVDSDAVAQPAPVAQVAAVDEHLHVVAHFPLVIKHVTANLRPALEVEPQQLGHGRGRQRRARA